MSLSRSIVGYLPATFVPAILSFVAVYTFSRLLSATEYGYYNLTLNGVMIAQAACFYGLQVGLTRFYRAAERDGTTDRFLKTGYLSFLVLGFVVGLIAAIVLGAFVIHDPTQIFLLLAPPLLLMRAAVSINQALNRAASRVGRFNLVECSHAGIGYVAGAILVLTMHLGATGVLGGMLVGAVVAAAIDFRLVRHAFDPMPIDREVLDKIVRYAWPLTLAFATSFTLQNADRFLIGTFSGAAAAGIYAVAVSLIDRPVTLVCMSITTAAFPLAIQALEKDGHDAAAAQLGRNGAALIAMVMPACAGLAVCSQHLAHVMVGEEFRSGVATLIPVLSIAAFGRGVAVQFLEHAFHLARRPGLLLWIYVPVTVLSIGLNVLLLPRFGMMGAAWVAVGCQLLLLTGNLVVGQRIFRYPFPVAEVVKVSVGVAAMVGALLLTHFPLGWTGFLAKVATGAAVYGVIAVALDLGGLRTMVVSRVRKRRG